MKKSFTLLELLIVIVIIGILATLAVPMYEGYVIKAKMAELYQTVGMIIRAEEAFFMETGFYASALNDDHPGYDLPYTYPSLYPDGIGNFKKYLGLGLSPTSVFCYGVYYIGANTDTATIYVRVRDHFENPPVGWDVLCHIPLQGPNKGTWFLWTTHPWKKYLNPQGKIGTYTPY